MLYDMGRSCMDCGKWMEEFQTECANCANKSRGRKGIKGMNYTQSTKLEIFNTYFDVNDFMESHKVVDVQINTMFDSQIGVRSMYYVFYEEEN
ncbi:hypothetical protein HB818_14355 [Listeria booriae]|uniref:hypothetical protein n=1 Tax=Listeria booriae TaxID=1552123 RepID=UPI00162ADD85|nr:hypothetical protein [Listeria booriae]MBC1286941.1 hypothetical protein [Listeria booriae]